MLLTTLDQQLRDGRHRHRQGSRPEEQDEAEDEDDHNDDNDMNDPDDVIAIRIN